MNDLWIRPMKAEDIDEVLVIESLCFPTPWSREAFRAEIEDNYCARYVVAELEGMVIGYGGMWIIIDEAHITNIAVHPNYRGRGVGEAIMKGLIQTAARLKVEGMTLEVRVSNMIAQNLYKKLGFVAIGVRKGYYTDNGEDALIMWRGKYTKQ